MCGKVLNMKDLLMWFDLGNEFGQGSAASTI